MRKGDLKLIESLFEEVNPFRMANDDGTSRIFITRLVLYEAILEQIDAYSAITYIETEYVIAKILKVNYPQARHIYMKYFKPLGIERQKRLELDMKNLKGFYRNFIKALHSIYNTSFDIASFDRAWVVFVASMDNPVKIQSSEEYLKQQEQNESERNRINRGEEA